MVLEKIKKISRPFMKPLGFLTSTAALYYCFKNVDFSLMTVSLKKMQPGWIPLIILLNFIVLFFKTWRWKVVIQPIRNINFWFLYRTIILSYLLNNLLPARLGEAARIHYVGKKEGLSLVTTASSFLADRLLEGLSFTLMIGLIIFFFPVPSWLFRGALIMLGIVFATYLACLYLAKKTFKRDFLCKFKQGINVLLSWRITLIGLILSILAWIFQIAFLYFLNLSLFIPIPLWGIVLILIGVNLTIALPSAPAHLGTFEVGCLLVTSFLGIEPSLGFLLATLYHFLQLIPLTLVGGAIFFYETCRLSKKTEIPTLNLV